MYPSMTSRELEQGGYLGSGAHDRHCRSSQHCTRLCIPPYRLIGSELAMRVDPGVLIRRALDKV